MKNGWTQPINLHVKKWLDEHNAWDDTEPDSLGFCPVHLEVVELENADGIEYASLPREERLISEAYCMECGLDNVKTKVSDKVDPDKVIRVPEIPEEMRTFRHGTIEPIGTKFHYVADSGLAIEGSMQKTYAKVLEWALKNGWSVNE